MLRVTNEPNVTEWSLENGYIDIANKNSYPKHVYASQDRATFTVYLQGYDSQLDFIVGNPLTAGFKVFLHTPGEVLRSFDQSFKLPFEEDAVLFVKPRLVTTATGLQKYSSEQRQCFFGSERWLKFFNVYTQSSCELECLANYTLKECGCVKFSMPSNSSHRIR